MRFYTQDDLWLEQVDVDVWRIGLTKTAIGLLQEITFCDFTIKSGAVTEGQSLIFLEGLKTVREIVAPFSGVVLEVNESVCNDLSLLNRDPEYSGWLILFQGIPTDGIFLQTEDIDAGNSTLDN